MKIRILPTLWVCAGLLASCGGGDSTKPEGEPSGLGACTPPSASPGAAVVCEVKGISEDCTVFFGGKPVEFVYHPENETVEFMVPPGLPGDKNIYAQCGDSGVKLIEKKFNVPGAGGGDTAEGEAVPPEGTAPAGEQGEVITPSGPGGTTTGGEAPPPDADSDGVADASDACPGTVAGTTVDSKGCPPPPPAPTTATIDKFNVDPVTSGAEMNTVKIEWGFSGAKAAYLWGDFNREAADASLAAAERCKLVGVRHLVTGPDGKKLNTGSDLYNKNLPFLEGTLCDNGNASKDDDCKSASSTTSFRPGRPLEERDLYAVQLEMKEQLSRDYIFEKKDMVAEIGPIIPLFVEETNPDCRIDLAKEDASLITTGTIYTRPLAQHAQFCLAAEGADDSWTVKCKNHEAPKADMTVTGAEITSKAGDDKPKVKVSLSYVNVVALPSITPSCSPETGSSWPALAGATGTLNALCNLSGTTADITATAPGIGANNKKTKKILAALGAPSLDLDWKEGPPGADYAGDVGFRWRIKQDYTIKDEQGATIGSGNQPWWVKAIRFNSGVSEKDAPLNKEVPVALGDSEGTVTLKRDHANFYWSAIGVDRDGKTFGYAWKESKYLPSFTLSNWAGPAFGWSGYDGCGGACEGDCGSCVDTEGGHVDGSVNWSGQHIKEIIVSCWMEPIHDLVGSPSAPVISNVASGVTVKDNADPDHYGPQNGVINVSAWVGNHDDWGSRFRCSFSYKTHDSDETIEAGAKSWWWDCNYDDKNNCGSHRHSGSGGQE